MGGFFNRAEYFRNLFKDDTDGINFQEITTTEEKRKALLEATVFLEDAINFRSIFHRTGKFSLNLYRFYYSYIIRKLVSLNIFVIMMLAFLEHPSSLSISCDMTMPKEYLERYEFPCGALESIDLFCLTIFLADCIIKIGLLGRRRAIRSPWVLTYFLVLLVSFGDCAFSLTQNCQETIRIRRYLRPFFLIQSSSLMKKTIKSLRKTIPQIISVFALLMINLYFFSIIGMLIFPRYYQVFEPNQNGTGLIRVSGRNSSNSSIPFIDDILYAKNMVFGSVKDSLINMFILLTTSNNPDVTLQSFSANRYAALFYILYLCVGLYCLMSLVTAVLYEQFKGFFQDSMMSSAFRQSLGIRASFWVLLQQFGDKDRYGFVPKAAICYIIKHQRISKSRKRHLIASLNEMSYAIQDLPELMSSIDLEQYEKLFNDNLNNEINDDLYDSYTPSNMFSNPTLSRMLQNLDSVRRYFKKVFESKWYTIFSSVVVIANVALITIELHMVDDLYDVTVQVSLSYTVLFCAFYYFFENLLKVWSLEWRRYMRNHLQVADGVVSLTFFILQLTQLGIYGRPYLTFDEMNAYDRHLSIWGVSRVINMLLIFRLIDIAPSVKVLYAVLSTIVDMLRSLRPILGIIVSIYYVYGLLGMQLFAFKINYHTFDLYNTSDPMEYCGTFKQLNYWPNNFDDFYAAQVLLWNSMVANSWQVIMDSFVLATNEYSRLYFLIWWGISTVIMMSIYISLIIDLFVLKWAKISQMEGQEVGGTGGGGGPRANIRHITPTPVQGRTTRTPLLKSIHNMFNDMKWKPDSEKLNEELLKHEFTDFKSMILSYEDIDLINLS